MAITLDQFRAISNGTHNVGQIMLSDDKNGLQKINNHVWQTSKNNVQTTAADNRAVRQALYDAFENSNTVSKAMLKGIKKILLGGMDGSRSLSRDFVKQLFLTVDNNAEEGDWIDTMMVDVSKSLSERKVSVVKNNLVTSSKDAAYTIYASEKMDACARKAQMGFLVIKRVFESAGQEGLSMVGVHSGVDKMMKGILDMIENDQRTANRDALVANNRYTNAATANIRDFFKEQLARIHNSLKESLTAESRMPDFIQDLKEQIRDLYENLNLRDVGNDHLARIFPPEDNAA